MAGEHHFVTGPYFEVNELLQSAREVKDHVGGRKMTEAEFQEYNRNIVARDLELVSLIKDLRRLRQELAVVSPEGAQTEEEKAWIKLKLRLVRLFLYIFFLCARDVPKMLNFCFCRLNGTPPSLSST